MKLISELIKIFLTLDFNAQKAFNYLNNDLKISCSNELINKVYKEIRNIIPKYLFLEYERNLLGSRHENKFYAIDECNILNIGNIHIWLLGIIETGTKNFLLAPTLSLDSDTLKNFITKYVEKGNQIITDGWVVYDYLDRLVVDI